jgi:hypothetical protein
VAIRIPYHREPPRAPNSVLLRDVDALGQRNTTAKLAARTVMKPFWGTHETKWKQMGGRHDPTRRRESRLEAVMNHSMHSADRATHLKIVVMALVAGIAIAGFAITARTSSDYSQSAQVVKAGKPIAVTSSGAPMVR